MHMGRTKALTSGLSQMVDPHRFILAFSILLHDCFCAMPMGSGDGAWSRTGSCRAKGSCGSSSAQHQPWSVSSSSSSVCVPERHPSASGGLVSLAGKRKAVRWVILRCISYNILSGANAWVNEGAIHLVFAGGWEKAHLTLKQLPCAAFTLLSLK